MGLVVLKGGEKDTYIESLIYSLETAATVAPESDLLSVARLMRVTDFGKEMPELEDLDINTFSGLPAGNLLTYLESHKKHIEEHAPPDLAASADLVATIQDQIYQNDFRLTKNANNLKELLFSERLRSMDFATGRAIDISRSESLEVGRKYNITVSGYDVAKAGWLKYDVEIFKDPNSSLGRKPFIRDPQDTWGRLAPTDAPILAGKILQHFCDSNFSFNVNRWFDGLNETELVRVGRIRIQHIKGFYGNETDGRYVVDFAGLLAENPRARLFEFEEVDWEDTDLTLCDEFRMDDRGVPEMVKEHRRILVPTDDIRPVIEEYATRSIARCEVPR